MVEVFIRVVNAASSLLCMQAFIRKHLPLVVIVVVVLLVLWLRRMFYS